MSGRVAVVSVVLARCPEEDTDVSAVVEIDESAARHSYCDSDPETCLGGESLTDAMLLGETVAGVKERLVQCAIDEWADEDTPSVRRADWLADRAYDEARDDR